MDRIAKLAWEANDCGEQTGQPDTDSNTDIPICVEATATLADGRKLSVMVAAGSMKTGTNSTPTLFSVSITGAREPVSRLSQIPVELHRDSPKRRAPRDIPTVPALPGAS